MSEPSNQTLKVMIETIGKKGDERHEDYKEIQINMDKKLDIILEQTSRTQTKVDKHEWYFRAFWWALGALWVIVVIGVPFLYKLYNYSLDVKFDKFSDDNDDRIQQIFDERIEKLK
jgi:hypothetical protein